MIVRTFKLLPDTEEIKFINFDQLEGGTIRIEMKIKGIHFKRLVELGSNYKPCWLNEDRTYDCAMMGEKETAELEMIFKRYLLDNKISLEEMTSGRRKILNN